MMHSTTRQAPSAPNEIMFGLIEPLLILAVIVFTLAGLLALAGVLHFSTRKPDGWLHVGVIAILGVGALGIATSGRSLSSTSFAVDAGRSALFSILIGPTSMLLVLLAAERIATATIHASKGIKLQIPASLLTGYVVFWIGNYLAPSLFGHHPHTDKSALYNLVIGCAFVFCSAAAANKVVEYARSTIVAIVAASLLFAIAEPTLVMDQDYKQGFIPGLPRLAGLAPHAIAFAFMVQIGMICLYARPFSRRLWNGVAWVVMLLALVMAQSKSIWFSGLLSVLYVAYTQYRFALRSRLMDPSQPVMVVVMLASVLLVAAVTLLSMVFVDFQGGIARFMATNEGAQLASLTGRDQIWAAAWEEWQRYPVFGYGLTAFDDAHRAMIGISSATHAHNQVFDTLARSGTVGLASLLFYVAVLLYWALRYNAQSNGVAALLMIALLCKCISEVPFGTIGYGIDSLAQWILFAIICGQYKVAISRGAISIGLPTALSKREQKDRADHDRNLV